MGDSADTTLVSYKTTANAIALPIFCALAIISAAVPFKEHWARKNIPMCILIVTLCVMNLIQFISTIIWPTDDFSSWWVGYGWCDIVAALKDPLVTLVSTTTCCLTINLARAFDIDNPVSQTRAAKRRKAVVDTLFCFFVPFFQIILHYIVQANRYNIGTIYGCENAVDLSWPTLLISWIWTSIYGIVNVFYALLVVYRLRKYRDSFARTLSSTGSNLTARGFLKLFLFSCSLLVVFFPIIMYYFYLNVSQLVGNIVPYSWSRVHDPEYWHNIYFYSLAEQPGWQYDAWCAIVQSTLTFFYFGMGGEAKEQYRRIMVKCGLAKIWPSLLIPVGANRSFDSRRASTSSWSSKIDVVGHALRYFDNPGRKSSQGTVTECSIHSKSRKASTATFDHISLAADPHKNTLSDSFCTNPDRISQPCYPEPTASTYHRFEVASPSTHGQISTTQHHARSFLGSFRTHINLPTPLFHSKSSSITHNNRTVAQCTCSASSFPMPPSQPQPATQHRSNSPIDLEAQSQSAPNTNTFAVPPTSTVDTQIWSETSMIDSPLLADEWEPKKGTRAYRERERRELEAELRKMVVESSVEQSTS